MVQTRADIGVDVGVEGLETDDELRPGGAGAHVCMINCGGDGWMGVKMDVDPASADPQLLV